MSCVVLSRDLNQPLTQARREGTRLEEATETVLAWGSMAWDGEEGAGLPWPFQVSTFALDRCLSGYLRGLDGNTGRGLLGRSGNGFVSGGAVDADVSD